MGHAVRAGREIVTQSGSNAGSGPSASVAGHEEIRAQVRRIAASRYFVRSRRLCRFLYFSVEQTLVGRASCIKEQLVGVEVFDRKPDYDPRVDPIVRVEARRLRVKLKEYYDDAGPSDAVRIEFPVGSYAPLFFPCGAGSLAAPQAAGQTSIAMLPFANLTPGGSDD
jgi:hypothetical protein